MNKQNNKPWLGKSQFFFLLTSSSSSSLLFIKSIASQYIPPPNSTLSISASFWFTGTFNKRREKRDRGKGGEEGRRNALS